MRAFSFPHYTYYMRRARLQLVSAPKVGGSLVASLAVDAVTDVEHLPGTLRAVVLAAVIYTRVWRVKKTHKRGRISGG
jgi:hypothetical protein